MYMILMERSSSTWKDGVTDGLQSELSTAVSKLASYTNQETFYVVVEDTNNDGYISATEIKVEKNLNKSKK